jgi:hypothetical protein
LSLNRKVFKIGEEEVGKRERLQSVIGRRRPFAMLITFPFCLKLGQFIRPMSLNVGLISQKAETFFNIIISKL